MAQPAWYAVAVYTGQEFAAVEELTEAGCREVVCPTYREVRRRDDKQRTRYKVDAALLPGYVFARIPEGAWGGVYKAKAVFDVLSASGEPLAIVGAAERELEAFFRRADLGEYDQQGADERVKPGDVLKVLFGPWAGHSVEVIKRHAHELEVETDVELFGGVRGTMRVAFDEVQPEGRAT